MTKNDNQIIKDKLMKLFLKPTAIFACAVLLFCGCGDDDTEDLSFVLAPVSLDSPYDVSVASGEGRAEVTWRVPDDSSITHAMVQWDDATDGKDATINEIIRVEVIPGQRKTYSIGEVDAGELSAGDHNFYITHITANSSGVITARSETYDIIKYIYDESTYSDSRPNPYNVKTSGTKEATISWSKFKDDFLAVSIKYYPYSGGSGGSMDEEDMVVSGEFYIDENDNTTYLDDVELGTDFNFYSYFKPDDGLDVVEIGPAEDNLSMDKFAASPTNVSVLPGLGRMRVQWMVPSNEDIVASIVKYQRVNNGDGDEVKESPVYIQYGDQSEYDANLNNKANYLKAVFSEEDTGADIFFYSGDILINNRNERYISGDYANPSGDKEDTEGGDYYASRIATHLTEGYYIVEVYNLKDNGYASVPTEDAGTIQTIHVYDNDTFVRPTLSGVPIRNVNNVVTFDFVEDLTWNNGTSACSTITIYYAKTGDEYEDVGEGTEITGTIEYFATTGISDAEVGEQFTYSALFEPSGSSFDPMTLAATAPDDNSFMPDVAPDSPSSVDTVAGVKEITSDYTGYDTQTPTINVTWTPGSSTTGVEAYKVYWYSSDVSATTYTTAYLQLDELGTNGLTAAYTLIDSSGADEHDNRTYTEFYYTITENLVAGVKYSVEVSAATGALEGLSGRTESERTEVILKPTTYGYDTYKDEVLTYSVVKNNGDVATLMWDNLHEDIAGVAVYYNKEGLTVRYPETGYEVVSSTSTSTELEKAYIYSNFQYIAYYAPYGSTDVVKVKWDDTLGTQSGTIPDPVPVPSGLSCTTSYKALTSLNDDGLEVIDGYSASITLEWWELVDIDNIVDKMYVRYTDESGVSKDVRVSLKSTTYTMDDLEVGETYTLQVVTEDTDTSLTSESETVTTSTYSPESYSTANLPVATAVLAEEGDAISVTWTNLEKCSDLLYLYIWYNGERVNPSFVGNASDYGYPSDEGSYEPYTLSDLTNTTSPITFTAKTDAGGTTIKQFTYYAYYAPNGGAVSLKVDGGSGYVVPYTDDDYIQGDGVFSVYTGKGLLAVSEMISNSSAVLDYDINLMNDIDLSAVCGPSIDSKVTSWTPIGSSSKIYSGTFDGGGYTIHGLYINKESSATYQGLFGYVNGATIQNVEILSPTIVLGSYYADYTPQYVGVIAGNAVGTSTISGCTVTDGSISILSSSSAPWNKANGVGGIVGYIAGDVVDCVNEANIIASGAGRVGGIAGYVSGSNTNIVNCQNSGNISYGELYATSGANYNVSCVGGIVAQVNDGLTNVNIIGCVNTGNLDTHSNVGGIVGRFVAKSGGVFASYSTGNVTSCNYRVGGLVGTFAATETLVTYQNKIISTNSATVYNSTTSTADSDFAAYEANMVGCFNAGWVHSSYTSTDAYIGALVGGDFASNANNYATTGYTFVSYTNYQYNYVLYQAYETTVTSPVKWTIGKTSLNPSTADGVGVNEEYKAYLLSGTATDEAGIEGINNVVQYMNSALTTYYGANSISLDYQYIYSTGTVVTKDMPTLTKVQ